MANNRSFSLIVWGSGTLTRHIYIYINKHTNISIYLSIYIYIYIYTYIYRYIIYLGQTPISHECLDCLAFRPSSSRSSSRATRTRSSALSCLVWSSVRLVSSSIWRRNKRGNTGRLVFSFHSFSFEKTQRIRPRGGGKQ